MINSIKKLCHSITIEPVVFCNSVALTIITGSQITTNLLIWKTCRVKLNYSEEICGNLTDPENDQYQLDVQENVNNFLMYSQLMQSIPTVIFSVIAGALSDRFGRKPLIFYPLLGVLVGRVANLLNYIFIGELPIEFFFVDNIRCVLGGYTVFYQGIYSFGTNASKPKHRAHCLARLDGVETLAAMAGTLLSPVVFNALGYYGSYSISTGLTVFGLVYIVIFVKEPMKNNYDLSKNKTSFRKLLLTAFITPVQGMKSLMTKKRTSGLKILIFLQLVIFSFYWLTNEILNLTYLYMLLIFPEFNGTKFAIFRVVVSLANAFFLMLAIPLLNKKFKFHDTTMLLAILGLEAGAYLITPFVSTLWQFYLTQIVAAIGYSKNAVLRTLLSKCIGTDEIGKVYSLLAVISAMIPVASNPLFRNVFNATSENFSGTIFILAGSFSFAAVVGHLILCLRRHLLVNHENFEVPTISGNITKNSIEENEPSKG